MPLPKTPLEIIEAIRGHYAAGKPAREIAKELGVSMPTVYKYIADLPRQRSGRRRSGELEGEIEAFREQGLTVDQIACALRVSPRTVQRHTSTKDATAR